MFTDKNSDIFQISAQNIDCGYSLEPPRSKLYRYVFVMKFSESHVWADGVDQINASDQVV